MPAGMASVPDDLAEWERIKEYFSIEVLVDAYAHHYGLDPIEVEKKDIFDLMIFQALRTREAVIQHRRMKK